MPGFGYVNQNNPVFIGELESQEMINARIDRGYLEWRDYKVDESIPIPNRLANLPNGKVIMVRGEGEDKFLGEGEVKWKNQKEDDSHWTQPGLYWVEDEENTKLAFEVVAAADADPLVKYFKPVLAGYYYYAVTVYDEKTLEESAPMYYSVNVTEGDLEGNGCAIRITMYKMPLKWREGLTIRFYRQPFGGGAYLLDTEVPAKFMSDDDELMVAGEVMQQFLDPSGEELLTYVCETLDYTLIPFGNAGFRPVCLSLFDDKIWIGGRGINDSETAEITDITEFGILYYSRTGDWTSFPAKNFFTFPDPVVGLTKYDQTLVVQTRRELYYIYGEPDAYSIKQIDYRFDGLATNSGQSLGDLAYLLALGDAKKPDEVKGLYAYNSSSVLDISAKIYREFPGRTNHRNWTLDNRFFIFELLTDSEKHIRRICYDYMSQGFCFVEPTRETFYYRTKEFSALPNGKRFLKKVCIRAKGAFTFYVVADGSKVLTKVRLTSEKIQNHFCYVKPQRGVTFSFVFEGHEGTEIYDWSIVE